jgi:hypothetical protein
LRTVITAVVTRTEFASLCAFGALKAALVGAAKTGRTWTVTKVTAVLRTVITAVVTGTELTALVTAITITRLAVGPEATITAAKATLAAFGKAVISISAGTPLVTLGETATAFAVVTSRTAAIGAPKTGSAGALVALTLRACATLTASAFAARAAIGAACGPGATGCRRLFRLGRLGRCTQNRARRRCIGGRGGIAGTWGPGLFRRFD